MTDEQAWKTTKKFDAEEDFRDYLILTLKLPNADAIIQKLLLEHKPLVFGKGTRRLHYADSCFYLEQVHEQAALDVGTGKHINIKLLQERWQRLAPNLKVTAKLDKEMEPAVSIREYDEGGVAGIHVRLNPLKLRGPKQVDERIRWVDKSIRDF